MQVIKILFLTIFSFCFQQLFSQVSNDNIENRITLELNKPHFSKTNNCTLQPSCLNKQIEQKCITYHNDQWFEFSIQENKNYFLNISDQNCRDIQGVQLVVIDGIPCETETYKSLGCISLNTQDDVYLKLESLKENHNYLVLVDGYLEDYCKFEIELSDTPKGNPTKDLNNIQLNHLLTEDIVNFTWNVNELKSNNYSEYEIYRRESKERKSKLINTLYHEKDAYGNSKLVYNSSDTIINSGIYFYNVFAKLNTNGKEFLGQLKLDFDKEKVKDSFSNHELIISRTYKKSTAIEVLITDAITDAIIISDYRPSSRDHQLFYNIKPALDIGITLVKVSIKNVKKSKTEVFEIDWNKYLKE